MTVIRELRAKFSAEAQSLKSVIEDVKRSTRELAKGQDTARKSMQGVGQESDTMAKKFKMADGRMGTLNRSATETGNTFKNTGQSAASLGKNISAAGSKTEGASKSFGSMNGQAVTMNRTFGESAKTFKTAGGSLTSLGRHFSSAEVSAVGAGKQFQSASGQMMTLNRTTSDSVKTFKTAGGSITSLGKHFTAAETSAITMGRGLEGATGRMTTLSRSAGDSAKNFKIAGGQATSLGNNFSAAQVKAAAMGKQVSSTAGGVSKLGETISGSTKTFKTNGQSISDLGKHYSAAETNAVRMKDSVQQAGSTVSSTSSTIEGSVKGRIAAPFRGAIDSVRNFASSVRNIVTSLGVFTLIDKGIGMVTNSLAGAISRYDTLNNFPRVLELMGFDAEQSSKAIDRLSEGIDGLPTTLDSVVGTAQRIAILTDDIDSATETTIALNNAFLASGTSAGDAQRGLEQYVQMLSKGEVDLQSWRSLQETMPVALARTAEAFGYTGRSAQNDLYAALKDGSITFDEFNNKIIELSNKTGGFADMARESGAGIATSWSNMKTAIVRGTTNLIESVDKSLGGVGSIAGFIEKMKSGVNGSFKAMEAAIPPVIGVFKLLGDAVKQVKDKTEPFRDGLNGVKEALQGNDTPLRAFMSNMGKTWDETQKALDAIHNFRDGIKGLIKAFQGDTTGATSLFVKMGLTWDEVQRVFRMMDTLKENLSRARDAIVQAFESARPYVETAMRAILDVVMSVVMRIVDFWKSDGRQLLDAITNVFTGVLAVVKFVMPLVLGIIKSVWGNITGVIDGALNIILGVVKVFSGLFTGDFSKMWEGVKQLFMGAVEFIWNFVQLTFYGKILGGAKTFIVAFKSGFSSMWAAVKALFSGSVKTAAELVQKGWTTIWNATKMIFTNIGTFLRDTWNSIKSITTGAVTLVRTGITTGWNAIKATTTTVFTAIKNFLTTTWNTIKNFLSSTVTNIRNFISNGWTSIKNTTSTIFNNVWNTIKTAFTNSWNFVKTTATNIKNWVSTTWTNMKTDTVNAFKSIYDTITKRFTDIVKAAKDLPKRIGDGIGSMASKVTEGVTAVIKTMASVLGKGINGVIGGINWVLERVNVKKLPEWPVPKYARGTDGHPGGLAVVGDGKGAYKGQELIQHPDGTAYLSPETDTLVNLPKGTAVLNAKDTREMMFPHYWNGIGKVKEWGSAAKQGAADLYGKAKNVVLDVFDYVKNPSKLFNLALDTLGIGMPSATGLVGDMVKGTWGKLKGHAVDYIKNMLTKLGGDFKGGKFGPPFRLSSRAGMRFHPIDKVWRMHYGDDYGAPMGTPVPSQSGGVVTQAGYNKYRGNFLRIKSGIYEFIYQHLQRMYAGMGQTVRKGMTLGTVGSTGASTGPHLHFEIWKNKKFVPPVSMGYADGGIVDRKQLAWIAEGGWAESIISHDPAKRVSQQAIWEQTGKELGFTKDDKEVIAYLRRIAENTEGRQRVVMDSREVAEAVEPHLDTIQGGKSSFRRSMYRG